MRPLLAILVAIVLLSSCGKRQIYFQEQNNSKNTTDKIQLTQRPDPRAHVISSGDILNVQMNTFNKEIMEQFNLGRIEVEGSSGPSGVIVDEEGYIFLPIAGKLQVNGLSISEAEEVLRDTLSTSLTDFNLSLKLSGFRVVVLGGANIPGVKTVPGDQATVLDAISLSGDLNQFGKPSLVKVIRNHNGEKKTIFMDLTDVDVFLSEGYYLQSNDIIYVGYSGRRYSQENFQIAQFAILLTNVVLIVLSRF